MPTQAYLLRCLSPLHAGSGDSNYDVIDNKVQRDPHTGFPTIFSSSLKGALREYFDGLTIEKRLVLDMFGAEIKKGKDAADTTQAGKLVFDQSFLLSLPVRSDVTPYFSASTPELLHDFVERLELFGVEKAGDIKEMLKNLLPDALKLEIPMVVSPNIKEGAVLEEFDFTTRSLSFSHSDKAEKIFGKPFALMAHAQFKQIELPVVARNQLDNGESKNLWYEELVPREARFFTTVTGEATLLGKFHDQVADKVIQVGANASVGYGRLLFLPLSKQLSK